MTLAHAKPRPRRPGEAHRTPTPAGPAGQGVGRGLGDTAPASASIGPAALQFKPIQFKVEIGAAGDRFEREAERTAEAVAVGRPAPPISRLGPAGLNGGLAQRRPQDDEEPVQTLSVQRQVEAAEEEEKEEPVQTLTVQRAVLAEEEEQPVQTFRVQRQKDEEEEPVQTRAGDGAVSASGGGAAMRAAAAHAIAHKGVGQPLQPQARARLERSLGADLRGVRVHTDGGAQQASGALRARAFTHGQDIWLARGESPHDLCLMAHEATHVLQQDGLVRRAPADSSGGFSLIPDVVLEELNDYARHIPGYTLFTVIIGFNPLLGADVARTPINLLEGLMGLVPFGTAIFDKLNELGIIQDAFAWVEGELSRLDLSLSRLVRTIEQAYEEMDFVRLDPFDFNLAVLRRHLGGLYDDVVAFAGSLVGHIIDLIKQAAIGLAEELLAENRAWALIKKVLHYDPLRGENVDATTVEILEDFLLLIGKEQEVAQMREKGTLQETADWLDTQLAIFQGLLAQLSQLISAAWDAIQPENLPNLMTNLQGLADQAFGFLQQAWDFAATVALKVLELIKHALLGWLSEFAHEVPGFHLITVILGRNPFTGEPVPRTAENIIRGFITLLPNGQAIYSQLAETGTIAQAAARIEGAMTELGISWEFVTGIFLGIWDSLSIGDLIDPIGAFTRIRDQFGEPISRLFRFVTVVLRELFMIILQMMNFPTDLIASIISNALQAIEDIKRDPVAFLLNMLAAVKQGFSNFFNNILTHLIGGLADWLFRGLRAAGIEPPADLSLRSVLDFVLQVLGISMERIWQKLAERIGQETVDRIRGAIDRLTGIWNFVRDVQERGVAAIWEYIESQISGLWDMVLEKAREWIMERIINRAIQWLLSLLDPTGIMPVINSFIAFFHAVQSAIEYLRDILAIINDYVTTVAAIARGAIEPGAQKLEQGLANAIPVAIGFLANQFGLGNIGEKIQEIVGGIRALVDRALDWLIDRAVSMVQSLLRSLGFDREEDEAADIRAGEYDGEIGKTVVFDGGGERHRLFFEVHGGEPELMVASAKQALEDFLNREEVRPKDEYGEEYRRAWEQAQAILASASLNAEEIYAEIQRATAPQTGADAAEEAQEDEEVEQQEETLADHLRVIFSLIGARIGGGGQDVLGLRVRLERAKERHHRAKRSVEGDSSAWSIMVGEQPLPTALQQVEQTIAAIEGVIDSDEDLPNVRDDIQRTEDLLEAALAAIPRPEPAREAEAGPEAARRALIDEQNRTILARLPGGSERLGRHDDLTTSDANAAELRRELTEIVQNARAERAGRIGPQARADLAEIPGGPAQLARHDDIASTSDDTAASIRLELAVALETHRGREARPEDEVVGTGREVTPTGGDVPAGGRPTTDLDVETRGAAGIRGVNIEIKERFHLNQSEIAQLRRQMRVATAMGRNVQIRSAQPLSEEARDTIRQLTREPGVDVEVEFREGVDLRQLEDEEEA